VVVDKTSLYARLAGSKKTGATFFCSLQLKRTWVKYSYISDNPAVVPSSDVYRSCRKSMDLQDRFCRSVWECSCL